VPPSHGCNGVVGDGVTGNVGASVSDVAELGDGVLDVPSPSDEVGDVAEDGDGVLVVSPPSDGVGISVVDALVGDGVGVSVGDGVISHL
jgi:hypothetical protein